MFILWSLACCMQQYTSIGAEAPVVMLTRTIDASKWLLVQEHTETVLMCHTLHQTHSTKASCFSAVPSVNGWNQ